MEAGLEEGELGVIGRAIAEGVAEAFDDGDFAGADDAEATDEDGEEDEGEECAGHHAADDAGGAVAGEAEGLGEEDFESGDPDAGEHGDEGECEEVNDVSVDFVEGVIGAE